MQLIEAVKSTRPSIYEYQNPRQFLLDCLSTRQKENSKFSARAWAKEMSLPSPSLLIMILQGSRPLRLKHMEFLDRGLMLSTPEQLYLRALIQFDNANSIEEKKLCEFWISELNPGAKFKVNEISEYEVISKWLHFTIMTMTRLKSFDGSVEAIQRRLGNKVTVHEIRSALIRLQDLGFISRDPETGKLVCLNSATSTRDDVALAASKEYFKDVFKMAEEAVKSQSVHEREFQALAIAVPHDKIALAKEMIRQFRAKFIQAIVPEDASADHVYQLNLQFFRLTESPSNEESLLENEGAYKQLGHKESRTLSATAEINQEGNV
jgi:uncharacterized protein (TIGR02147 family)